MISGATEKPAATNLILYSYWRSTAAWRVRMALAWKGLPHAIVPIDLRLGEQAGAAYRAQNPQGLVPLLVDGGTALSQSLAILEYLEEIHPSPPLLPADAIGRARVRAAAQIVACDTHPLNNLRVQRYLKESMGQPQAVVDIWARHWIETALTTLEAFASRYCGRFTYGDELTIADLCLVPQLYNARRMSCDPVEFVNLCRIEQAVLGLPSLVRAHPESQIDAG
jgi:maleylacetoacetate isomerase